LLPYVQKNLKEIGMALLPEDILKLVLAVVVGGLLGAEREYRSKAAGFRTLILICAGATLFTMFSYKLGGKDDAVRIAANIVSGVGFLGAGAIMRGVGSVVGLTTAAMIWLSAALGIGIGGGEYAIVGVATIAVLIVLWLFPQVEARIDVLQGAKLYEVVCAVSEEKYREIEALFAAEGLKVHRLGREKKGARMICRWEIRGKPDRHEQVAEKLFAHPDVEELRM
jgi:putative Mg2+ transporter-C (MgtC) family protein